MPENENHNGSGPAQAATNGAGSAQELAELLAAIAIGSMRVLEKALHDPLTGLPNRSQLSRRLADRLAAGESPAVIFLELDSFRVVKDRVGHLAADELLVDLAKRLTDQAAETELVARVESDTFAVITSSDGAASTARRMARSVAEPVEISGRIARTTASIGIVESGRDAERMLRDADLAVHRASREGGARIKTFDPGMHEELMKRREL